MSIILPDSVRESLRADFGMSLTSDKGSVMGHLPVSETLGVVVYSTHPNWYSFKLFDSGALSHLHWQFRVPEYGDFFTDVKLTLMGDHTLEITHDPEISEDESTYYAILVPEKGWFGVDLFTPGHAIQYPDESWVREFAFLNDTWMLVGEGPCKLYAPKFSVF